MHLPQLDSLVNLSDTRILELSNKAQGRAGFVLNSAAERCPHFRIPAGSSSILFQSRDPDSCYTHFLLRSPVKNPFPQFLSFSWRQRKFHLAVHLDMTATIHSTTLDGRDLVWAPFLFDIPADIVLEGGTSPIPVSLSARLNNHGNTSLHGLICAKDSAFQTGPVLGSSRSGVCAEIFAARAILKRALIRDVKAIWKKIERTSPIQSDIVPWWADYHGGAQDHKFLVEVAKTVSNHIAMMFPDIAPFTLITKGRTILPDGTLTRPLFEIELPYGSSHDEVRRLVSVASDALNRPGIPVTPLQQVSQRSGKATSLLRYRHKRSFEAASSHEKLETYKKFAEMTGPVP